MGTFDLSALEREHERKRRNLREQGAFEKKDQEKDKEVAPDPLESFAVIEEEENLESE